LPRRSVVLADDETALMRFPSLWADWSCKGEPAEVHIRRAGDFQTFIKEIREHYRGRHVAPLLGGDPSPTSKVSVVRLRG
jgi:hypothetical protein